MAAEILTLDPTSENAANSPLVLTTGSYGLTEHRYPQPAIDPQWASSVSTEGSVLASQRYQNREISVTVEVDCTANLTPLRTLQAKLAKLAREGGTLQRTMSDATVIVFDVLTCDGYDPSFDQTWHLGSITTVSFTLTCEPFGRGPELTLTSHPETTLPALVFTETGIKGDIPGLGRLVIQENQASDQWWATWGVQSRYYDSASTAALFYEAEGRTAMGGSATAVGPSGASGAGSNVMRNTALATSYQAILSTQATGGGAHLTHHGTFRVYARVQRTSTNTGTLSVALNWAVGDFRTATTNTPVDFVKPLFATTAAAWRLVDLGLITIPSDAAQWEGRIVAKSTVAGDDVDVDYLLLVPADEGSGIISGTTPFTTPTAFSARDEFDQTAGTLTGKTLPIGGTWVAAGTSATDFSVDATSHTAQRAAVSDSGVTISTGALAIAGTATFTNVMVQVSMTYTTPAFVGTGSFVLPAWGPVARWVDASNMVYVTMSESYVLPGGTYVGSLRIIKRVGGSQIVLDSVASPSTGQQPPGVTKQLRLVVDDQGRAYVYADGTLVLSAQHPDMATGGALASGKAGFVDIMTGSSATTRSYDDFMIAVPTKDAAVFASQSVEVRSDMVKRENSSGTFLTPVSSYEGDYLRVPPAGAEGRTTRVVVKACRNDPATMPDGNIDDIAAQLFYSPRYLNVPSA